MVMATLPRNWMGNKFDIKHEYGLSQSAFHKPYKVGINTAIGTMFQPAGHPITLHIQSD